MRALTDPLLRRRLGPLERHGPVPDPAGFEDVALVVVSHGHPDHFDRASLAAVGRRATVIVPRGLGRRARRATGGEVIEVVRGDRVEAAGITVEAVRARHWVTPGAVRAEPLGFVLGRGGSSVYFAGDTGPIPEMGAVAEGVDLALLPVWTWGPHLGPGHMGPRSAAEALAEIHPRAAVPIHWGTLYPRQLHRIWRRPLDEPGDRFARHAARLAPTVDVRVLRPGERATV